MSTAPASVFDNLNSSYDSVYAQGTLQTEYVRKLISRLSPGSSVLDIGCATGIPNGVLMEEAGLEVTGLDVSEKMLHEARRNVPTGTFYKVDAKLFIPTKPYDAVVCSLTLLMEPSIWNYSLAFRISSWLKPEGLLIFGTIDFNDFPVAPGYPIDPTGLTFYHTFMGTVVRDSTFEAGAWMTVFRRAGLRLVECEQRQFNPNPGKIEPEPQCYFLASKTGKNALLGPYVHPYEHHPPSSTSVRNSWSSLMGRCSTDVECPSPPSESWIVSPEQLAQACPAGVKKVELRWLLDTLTECDIGSVVQAWSEQNPALEQIILVQASPSNHALEIINSVARFLGLGMQHHGALVSGFLSKMNVSDTDDCVKIELVPAYLDFTNVDDSEFLTEAAGFLVGAWLPAYDGEESGLVRNLVEKRLSINLGEFVSLGQVSAGKIGFDCIAVTIDLGMRKPCDPLLNNTS
jgi:SAM-dependent methyltransferase